MVSKKSGRSDDLVSLLAMLPWWVGVALAVLSFLVLNEVASQPIASSVQPGQVGVMVTQTLWRTLAAVGQFVVPVLCLAGAGISAWRRRERRQLIDHVTRSDAAQALDGMSWQQFEHLVGEGFRLQGYRVLETGGGGADGGIDLVLHRDGEKYLVQCKQWRAFRVGVDVVRELYGVMAAKGVAGGFVVTSGSFTEEAHSFASGRNVKLIDGPQLRLLIKQAMESQSQASDRGGSTVSGLQKPSTLPNCPICEKGMVRRTAKRGSTAGQVFWGCSAYPSCKGTRPIG